MKKKLKITAIVILIILACGLFLASTKHPLKNPEDIEIHRVLRYEFNDDVDITDSVDIDKLKQLLTLMTTNRVAVKSWPVEAKYISYDIECSYKGKNSCIRIGTPDISKINTGYGNFSLKIQNSDSWIVLLDSLVSAS